MKKKILITDDVEMNREILGTIFEDKFEVLEAENGARAIEIVDREKENLSLIFLDLMMPVKDGLEVLQYMHSQNLHERIPVIMITGEATTDSDVKAYEYGAADIIYKPFSRRVVTRRALNIIELYESRRNIEEQLNERTAELKDAMNKLSEAHRKLAKNNDFLINALSSVVEFRNLESGQHVLRVQKFTEVLMNTWCRLHPDCGFVKEDIDQMVAAASLHDLGKIAIPDNILCKPGRLTAEEYEIMKTHTLKGCELLERFKQEDSDFYHYSYDICRYHHERYDGGGYPDGLKGDQIPVWAQVVSVVDVFDALISPRVYKKAFDIETAWQMIHRGECGTFSPKLLECMDAAKEQLEKMARELEH